MESREHEGRRLLGILGAAVLASQVVWLFGTGNARAGADKVYTGLIADVGVGGHDLVAYQTEQAALRGKSDIAAAHEGVTYLFAPLRERGEPRRLPGRSGPYLPRYGGYCAWAVANGYTAKGDPEAWSVVDGRLYLNYSKSIRSRWLADVAGNVDKGDANWPKVLE